MSYLARFLIIAAALAFSAPAFATDAPHGADPHAAAAHGESGHGEAAAHGGHEAPRGAPPVNWTDFGYKDKDVHGGKLDKGDEPMAPPLVLALLNFAIFAGILYWKAGPALSKYLANRHETIKNALEEAAKLQEEAKEKLKEYSERIADADSEVNELIEQIRKDAEAERERIVADAEAQAERMRKEAEARIESEFIRARRELEREVVAKAMALAEQQLRDTTTQVDQTTLVTGFISDLKAVQTAQGEGGLS
jgi:F-type H+-transporting ATPase subunit b